jgi:hypothetical protein
MNKDQLQEKLKLHQLYLKNQGGDRLDLEGADLRRANLISADLRRADLKDANLTGADFTGADLRYADLRRVNLEGADLRYADFRFADLKGANLSGANFSNCIGNRKEIKTIQTSKYWIVYTKDVMQIGCENHAIEKWFNFTDLDIEVMAEDALEWWEVWKPILKQIIEVENGN